MKQNLAEIVSVILRRLEEHPELPRSEKGMRSWLVGKGYSKRDIDAALKLVRPELLPKNAGVHRYPASVRQLTQYEQYKLTPDARSALARLELYDLLEPYEREMLFDRLNQYEGEVGMAELDYLVSWLLCSTRDIESQQTFYKVLEGEGQQFH